jgi:hypothetical protein
MWIDGAIFPVGDGVGFTREAWCQLVASRPEFQRPPDREGRNPFTGKTVTFRPTPDTATVLLNGQAIGNVYWSMSEEALVNVEIDSSGLPLVLEWAAALGGEFRAYTEPS